MNTITQVLLALLVVALIWIAIILSVGSGPTTLSDATQVGSGNDQLNDQLVARVAELERKAATQHIKAADQAITKRVAAVEHRYDELQAQIVTLRQELAAKPKTLIANQKYYVAYQIQMQQQGGQNCITRQENGQPVFDNDENPVLVVVRDGEAQKFTVPDLYCRYWEGKVSGETIALPPRFETFTPFQPHDKTWTDKLVTTQGLDEQAIMWDESQKKAFVVQSFLRPALLDDPTESDEPPSKRSPFDIDQ